MTLLQLRKIVIEAGVCLLCAFAPVVRATEISGIGQNSASIGRYEKFEVSFSLSRTYSDPFDPAVIDAAVVFTRPDLSTITVPAFYFVPYQVTGTNPEKYVNPGPAEWKARLAPDQVGHWTYSIRIIDIDGTATAASAGAFDCVESSRKGFIRVDKRNPLLLAYDNGQSRVNIGHNVCWMNGGLAGWQHYFSFMANAGENWSRLWMCSYGSNNGLLLEGTKAISSSYFGGVGKLSMPIAQRLDGVVELAEQNGIAFQLVLQHHGQFSTTTNSDWAANPYNLANTADGGFLDSPEKFFTGAGAIRLAKNKYRYIVSRWGYSPAIFAWELFNEVQFTDGWSSSQSSVVNWHNTMSQYIRQVDPFGHMITTSSHQSGFEAIWKLAKIDLIQVHKYSGPTVSQFEDFAYQLSSYNKPVVFGEFGIGSLSGVEVPEGAPDSLAEPYRTQIYEALDLHNGMWAAFHLRSSAHLWWWDNYIDKLNIYNQFYPLAVYAGKDDLAVPSLRTAERVVSGGEAIRATPGLSDFWALSTQTEFTLVNGRFPGLEKLSQYLHGSSKSTYRSDPTFNLTMSEQGTFVIRVAQVAPWGSNRIVVYIDGKAGQEATYANGSVNFDISVPLSAGPHKVQVKNTGQDWFLIGSYQFVPAIIRPIDSIGMIGADRAWLWIFDTGSQLGATANPLFEDETITVRGLVDGRYVVESYATRPPGGRIDSVEASSAGGVLTAVLPDFSRDIAVKIIPVCIVGLPDLLAMAAEWLSVDCDCSADINEDQRVDLIDMAELSGVWMSRCMER
jgi:hypothetical protein